jgi:membrane protease YdiL (CAAX protease family)
MNDAQNSPVFRLTIALGLLFVLAIVLVQIYLKLGDWFGSTLVGALMTHLVISIGYLAWFNAQGRFPSVMFEAVAFKWFVPGLMILLASIFAAAISRLLIPGAESVLANSVWLSILAVPIGEEIVFRGIIGVRLRQKLGVWTGAYLSALFFAWIHTMPTLEALAEANTGVFLGPFFLGIICEFLVVKTKGSLLAAISFHMICNATGPIFAWIDARWLKWLGILYL